MKLFQNQPSYISEDIQDSNTFNTLKIKSCFKNKRKNFFPRSTLIPLSISLTSTLVDHPILNDTCISLSIANDLETTAVHHHLRGAEIKFRDFALKTMQDLLPIYGLAITAHEILDAFDETSRKGKSY